MVLSSYTLFDLEIRSCLFKDEWLCVQSFTTLKQAKKAMKEELDLWHRDVNGNINSGEVRIVRRWVIKEVVS